MAKKNTSGRKSIDESGMMADEAANEMNEATESEVATPSAEDTPPQKAAKVKMADDTNSNVGLGDIRKAVAFANSVGGLDKAIALLQIVKVAKEVQ